MRTIKTTSGEAISVDGDLLAVMEALYKEVTAKREFERSFEDMVKEIHHLIEQMDDAERRTYLAESLFLNTVKYENDKLEAYMKKLAKKKAHRPPRHRVLIGRGVDQRRHVRDRILQRYRRRPAAVEIERVPDAVIAQQKSATSPTCIPSLPPLSRCACAQHAARSRCDQHTQCLSRAG